MADTLERRSRVTWSHRAEYGAVRAAVAALRLPGWRTAGRIGGALARLAYKPVGIRRGVVERQIAAALPDLAPDEVQRVARRAYDSLGRTSLEAATLAGAPPSAILERFSAVHGFEHLEAARARGRGAILVAGHLGNWELAGAFFAARGVPTAAIARRMANPLFDRYLQDTRRSLGMEIIHDDEAVHRTPRLLRQNHVVGFLCDQDGLGLASTYVSFFGRPARTPRGPAVFALRLGVPVLFIAPIRQPDGRYAMHIEPVPVTSSGDREADVDAIVQQYTAQLEAWVRRYPEQYFWHHRRWKRQPRDTPPHLREP
jgi:KDO2-lipid IV(A) lauroyltransferase